MESLRDIKGYPSWIRIEFLDKGWSEDKKFYIKDIKGNQYLLRISDPERYEQRRREYQYLQKMYAMGLPVSQPLEYGLLLDGRVYSLVSWVEGEDAITVICKLPEDEQYGFGLQAGRVQKEIHKLPASDVEKWGIRYQRKIDLVFGRYLKSGIRLPYEEQIMGYIQDNIHYLASREQTFQHGDYHLGNMIINGDDLYVIDFNRSSFGDPWEEYDRFIFSWEVSTSFANGQIHGYFEGSVPEEFFRLSALYSAVNVLASLPWASSFGDFAVADMMTRADLVYQTYQGFTCSIPLWYEVPLR